MLVKNSRMKIKLDIRRVKIIATQNSHVRKITPGVTAWFSSYGSAQAPSKYSCNKARSVAEKVRSVFSDS